LAAAAFLTSTTYLRQDEEEEEEVEKGKNKENFDGRKESLRSVSVVVHLRRTDYVFVRRIPCTWCTSDVSTGQMCVRFVRDGLYGALYTVEIDLKLARGVRLRAKEKRRPFQ
jgi:hypothetical protein